MTLQAHSDVIGSLLRPAELLEAQKRSGRGEMTPADFKRVEDRAVDEALALQESCGLDVVTDGEMRRLSFQSQFPAATIFFNVQPGISLGEATQAITAATVPNSCLYLSVV